MNLKNRMILEEYQMQRDNFIKLGDVVHNILCDIADELGVSVFGIEHRVKEEKSLAGKLERKGDMYSGLEDLTDILGARVICFFSDEIDKIGKKVEESFVVDWENFSDKRALIREDSFGYLSLHYICSLPFGDKWPDEICGRKFEIQIRTILQHTWSVLNHDIGYKSEFGMPRDVSRQFARLAGLMELADDEFVRTRDNMNGYTEQIRQKIIDNKADDIHINMVSLKEYVNRNICMKEFLSRIAAISGAEISNIDPESYIIQLKFLGIETLGQLREMIQRNEELALRLAEKALSNSDLDILASTVGLRFLCRAELLNKRCPIERVVEFMKLSVGTQQKAERQAGYLFTTYEKIKNENPDMKKLDDALEFATKKHKGQFRKGGAEYITHPVAVCEIVKNQGYGTDFQIAALFHDLLEDTDATEEEILFYGNETILEAVRLLTKEKGYEMSEYIAGIRKNEIAFAVKAADRLNNLRCAVVADEKFKRKYVLETVEWYLDFSPEIPEAVKNLAESMETRIEELPFLYEPVETWNQN